MIWGMDLSLFAWPKPNRSFLFGDHDIFKAWIDSNSHMIVLPPPHSSPMKLDSKQTESMLPCPSNWLPKLTYGVHYQVLPLTLLPLPRVFPDQKAEELWLGASRGRI